MQLLYRDHYTGGVRGHTGGIIAIYNIFVSYIELFTAYSEYVAS